MNFFEYLTLENIKKISSIVFSLAGLCIAFYGLKTWRLKLVGENKYVLSQESLIALREVIERIDKFRFRTITHIEMYNAYVGNEKKEPNLLDNLDRKKATKHVYNARWNSILDSYKKYKSTIEKTKVILNNYQIDKVNHRTLIDYIADLDNASFMREMVSDDFDKNISPLDDYSKKQIMDELKESSKIALDQETDDHFRDSLENLFNTINKRLQKYL